MKLFLILAALLATTAATAQERSAAGTSENQMTWSTLSTRISTVQDQVVTANNRVNDIVTCGKKGMAYAAPGSAGADTQGCIATAGTVPPSVTSSLNTNATNIANVSANITQIANCSASGGVIALSGSALVCNPAPAEVVPSFKAEVGSFSSTSSPGSTYCSNQGYDVAADVNPVNETYRCGGGSSGGGDCTRVASYTIKCLRIVKR